jgi:hypothetical protein
MNIYTNNDIKHLAALLLVAVASFFLAVGLNIATVYQPEPDHWTDTVTEYRVDTVWQDVVIHDTIPNLVYKQIVKTDTLYAKDGSEVPLYTENVVYADTLTNEEDSVAYRAYITGIQPRLDSIDIWMNRRYITETVTNTVKVKGKTKKSHFYYGIGVSAGYDPFNNKPALIIGAQAGIRL